MILLLSNYLSSLRRYHIGGWVHINYILVLEKLQNKTYQFVIFRLLSYCFEETIELDVKASFASRPFSRLIRWYNKRILRKGTERDFSWIENYKLIWINAEISELNINIKMWSIQISYHEFQTVSIDFKCSIVQWNISTYTSDLLIYGFIYFWRCKISHGNI